MGCCHWLCFWTYQIFRITEIFWYYLLFSFNDVFHHVEFKESLFFGRVFDALGMNKQKVGMREDQLNDSLLVLLFGYRIIEFGHWNVIVW